MDNLGALRCKVRTAGQQFILRVLPWHDADSRTALHEFIQRLRTFRAPLDDIDVILQRCLNILDRHSGSCWPSLTDRYLSQSTDLNTSVDRFAACVDSVLRYKGIGNRSVRRAIAVIEEHYQDGGLTQEIVAAAVETTPGALSAAFHKQTGLTFSQYIRAFRLDRATALLQSTAKSIKEVWALVGYNHASNFNHDFRERFNKAPREFLAMTYPNIGGKSDRFDGRNHSHDTRTFSMTATLATSEICAGRVLVVDDDEDSRLGYTTWLTSQGFTVAGVPLGRDTERTIARFSPEAIMLDWHLPSLDGAELFRQLRRLQCSSAAGVALMTGDVNIYEYTRDIEDLDAMVMLKPYDMNEAERIAACLIAAHRQRT